jgi:hypothetical protein
MSPRPLVTSYVLLASLVASGSELAGQQTDSTRLLRGRTVGVALDRFLADGGSGPTAVSLRLTTLKPGGVGADFAVGTYLPALAQGVMAVGLDLGPAFNLSGRDATALLRIGASTIVGASVEGGVAALLGGYVGGGVVARIGPRLGIRGDLAKRLYYLAPLGGSGTVWTVSLGLTSLRAP